MAPKKKSTSSTSKKKTVTKKKPKLAKNNTAGGKSAAATTVKVKAKGVKKTKKRATTTKKKVAAKKKVLTKLILKKFETWTPDAYFSSTSNESLLQYFTAPDFLSEYNTKDKKRIKTLLLKKFNIIPLSYQPSKQKISKKTAKASSLTKKKANSKTKVNKKTNKQSKIDSTTQTIAKTKVAINTKTKPPSIKKLLAKKFDPWIPDSIFILKTDSSPVFNAPDLALNINKNNPETIKKLLLKNFNLSSLTDSENVFDNNLNINSNVKKTESKKNKLIAASDSKTKPPSIKKLLAKKFDPWIPDSIFILKTDSSPVFNAPDLALNINKNNPETIKKLLLKNFNLSSLTDSENISSLQTQKEIVPESGSTSKQKNASQSILTNNKDDLKKKIDSSPEQRKNSKKDVAQLKTIPVTAIKPDAGSKPMVTKQEESPKIDVDFLPPDKKVVDSDILQKVFKYGKTAIFVLILLVICASYINTHRYYINIEQGVLKIWQGDFSPLGKKMFISIPGAVIQKPVKPVYTKKEAFSIIYTSFIDKADAVLNVPGLLDYNSIVQHTNKAVKFATSDKERTFANTRLNSINIMNLLYRTDVSISKETVKDLETAKKYLEKAANLDINDAQHKLIINKTATINELLKNAKAKKSKNIKVIEKDKKATNSSAQH